MNRRQKGTLEGLFADPVRANIAWHDIVSLLGALGAEVTERRGSRVLISLSGHRAVVHRPHPEHEAGKGLVRDLRQFLSDAGVERPA